MDQLFKGVHDLQEYAKRYRDKQERFIFKEEHRLEKQDHLQSSLDLE